ncbi:CotO family spore coat protein [Oceanobacillus jeddahense]|uniref:CotO family spore coat protein n=1 Tax=Oceanobacillus jeddahense TaxID=1462527 RepID=UPI00059629E9|nr:CotO family spore coat protein [Oceanobacillus jeddahense]
MTNKNKAQAPLLYISQPRLQESTAPMQENYVGDYRKQQKKNASQVPPKKKTQLKDNKTLSSENTHAKDQQSSKKKFMEMTIAEKINYLTNRSEFAPPIKCEIMTASKKKYRGIIREKEKDTLFLQLYNRKNKVKIEIEDIENIQLLGF